MYNLNTTLVKVQFFIRLLMLKNIELFKYNSC